MKQVFMAALAMCGLGASRAAACDGVVAVAPAAVVSSALVAPVTVQVVPATVVAPVAVQVDAFGIQTAAPTVQMFATPVQVRACIAPRVRVLQRPARSRVLVRVR